jgi:hypothetical protein
MLPVEPGPSSVRGVRTAPSGTPAVVHTAQFWDGFFAGP